MPPIPPLPSPGQPYRADSDKEPTTGEHRAAEIENALREREPHIEKNLREGMSQRLTVGLVGTVVIAVSTAFGAFFVLRAEAQTQGVEAAKQVDQKATATQDELTRYKAEAAERFKRIEHQGDRTEQKMDALLDRFSVPNPAPRPKDGGDP